MAGMYDLFETDKDLERNGVWFDYGSFRVRLRFAGGSNKAYISLLEKVMQPYRRAIDQGLMPQERLQPLLAEVFMKTIITDWQVSTGVDDNGEPIWKNGIETKSGEIVEMTEQTMKKVFLDLPGLLTDFIEQASKLANYRVKTLEDDAKN